MARLREKQKTDRHRRIVEAANQLFSVTDYELVRMEDIAEIAEVSVGTVYNYGNSKSELLTDIVASTVNSMTEVGEELIAAPPENVEEAINGLLFSYLEKCLDKLTREMWARAMAQSIIEPNSASGKRYNELDGILLDQVCRMIERLYELKRLREDIVPRDVGEMIFHNLNNQFYDLVRYDDITVENYKKTLTRQNRTLIEAIVRRPGNAG
tara:strand:+ start:476 stop:1108 length:633 start_codon:yes stop_codon:yes gene_type:complete